MQWITLDEALVHEGLTATEAKALLEAQACHAEAPEERRRDPIPGLCQGLAARIRQCVLAGGRTVLQGTELAIPAALRLDAVAILRYKVLTRLALNVSEDRRLEAQEAEKRLDAIARGELPLADSAVQQTPTYHGRPHRWKNPEAGGVMPTRTRARI